MVIVILGLIDCFFEEYIKEGIILIFFIVDMVLLFDRCFKEVLWLFKEIVKSIINFILKIKRGLS